MVHSLFSYECQPFVGKITTSTDKVSVEFWQNINQELFKVEYSMKLSKYFGNFAKAVKRSQDKTFFSKVSKIFAEFKKVFNFEKFLIHVLPKFN